MQAEARSTVLEDLGVLRVSGADAVPFLQGQLSSDVAQLTPEHSQLAGYHNPQGRVIALLQLVALAAHELVAITPRELVSAIVPRLARFVLRAKVKITDESTHWSVSGLIAPDAAAPAGPLPTAPGAVARLGESRAVRLAGAPARWLVLGPAGSPPALAGVTAAAEHEWQRHTIAAGEPQVLAATSEAFVAQMLNLDLLGAIAFDKGCYTGQEVIARTHYRGRIKRRMQRFATERPGLLRPGDSGTLPDGRTVRVVIAAPLASGGCEFLGVAPLAVGATDAPEESQPTRAQPIPARPLALPYALPQ